MNEPFATRFPRTATLLAEARFDAFPCYAVGVRSHEKAWVHSVGATSSSLFDLASVSKVLATTTLCAIAHERGVLSIDTPVREVFPAFPDLRVRISHLLNHSSGLPAWLPLHAHFHQENALGSFDPLRTPRAARKFYEDQIHASHQPGEFERGCVYSDLGFLLLGWALEAVTGLPLDELFQEWISKPTELKSLQYLPVAPDIVPTEDCPWRGRVLRGEVHDDNTFVLGGVAGHAGLFGNVGDVLAMGALWLDAWHGRTPHNSPYEEHLFSQATARVFWTKTHVPAASRVLGWDGVSESGSSTGTRFSRAGRGHLGYTGTSLWIDPEKDLVVTLLTNRVHPTRANEKIKAFRPIFHDSLLTELG